MSSVPALDVRDVSVRFGSTAALDGLSLTAPQGQITAVLGPNGAGKTTLVRSCVGLVRPRAGSISVLGSAPGSAAAATRVGLMPQSTGAWSAVRAGELISYLARLYANPWPVDALLRLLGIDDFAGTSYRRLSGGQRQLVNLAGALVGRPSLLFLDEPSSGMDPHLRRHTWQILDNLRRDGVAVLLTTHHMEEAAELADHVWLMDRGRVTIHGTVAELTAEQSLEDVFLANTSNGVHREP